MSENMMILQLCPASIWLLGGAANCNQPAGHDQGPDATPHQIKIEWVVQ
jgi:hypothetical protein